MASLQDIYDRLHSVSSFHPASAELFDDFLVEAGDIISVLSGESTFDVPIFSQHMQWNGSMMNTVQSTGNKERTALPPLQKRSKDRSYRAGQRLTEQEETMHGYEVHTEETDRLFSKTARAIGVQLGPDGLPMVDEHGDFIWDDEHGAEVFSRLELSPNRALLVSAINDHEGDQISGAKIDLSAQGTVLIQAINRRPGGQSAVYIEADKVAITGSTTIADVMSINASGYVSVSRVFYVGTAENHTSINSGTVNAKKLEVQSGGQLTFVGGQTGEYYNITATVLQGMIKSASVSGNVLTLTPFYGNAITFSKATTVAGSWNGSGTYTATATQNGTTVGTASTTPILQLNGNGSTNFSAQLLSDGSSQVLQKSVYCYLVPSGNAVNACKNADGTGVVASCPVSGADLSMAGDKISIGGATNSSTPDKSSRSATITGKLWYDNNGTWTIMKNSDGTDRTFSISVAKTNAHVYYVGSDGDFYPYAAGYMIWTT